MKRNIYYNKLVNRIFYFLERKLGKHIQIRDARILGLNDSSGVAFVYDRERYVVAVVMSLKGNNLVMENEKDTFIKVFGLRILNYGQLQDYIGRIVVPDFMRKVNSIMVIANDISSTKLDLPFSAEALKHRRKWNLAEHEPGKFGFRIY